MATTNNPNNGSKSVTGLVSSMSVSMRESFISWLSIGNAKEYSLQATIACLDRISEYVISKKISCSIWEISKPSVFQPVYRKVLEAKLLRIIEKNTHKMFISVGQLYLKFLKEDIQKQKVFNQRIIVDAGNNMTTATVSRDARNITNRNLECSFTYPGSGKTYAHKNVAEQNAIRAGLQITDVYQVNKPATAFTNITTNSNLEYSFTYPGAAKTYAHKNIAVQNAISTGLQVADVFQVNEPATAFVGLSQTVNASKLPDSDASRAEAESISSGEIEAAIELVLKKRYSNGFRLGSFIETERLRKFVSDHVSDAITLTDEELEAFVKACGTVFKGKTYIVSPKTELSIRELAEKYFASGATAIFFTEFFAKHEEWLIGVSVVSAEMLEELLRQMFPHLTFTAAYFGKTDKPVPDVLESELMRIWGDDVLLTYDALAERLKYIPVSRIRLALGQNVDFVWNSTSEFTHISKVDIKQEEKTLIIGFAEKEIGIHGYVSIADFPLDEIAERNYLLSKTAVHNAVFLVCLSDVYEQHGKIIAQKGGGIDAKQILDEYCRSLDRCTLGDLLDFERELTGESHRWLPMQAGYDIMVRVDRDTFLAERFLDFDCRAIDNAIEYFLGGYEYIPLRHITTFAPFPHCGQIWTLFLLESYCRRHSECFRFDVLSVNSTNAGAIVRKHSKLSYHDIIVDAVAKSDVILNAAAVLDFLVENGYTSRRRYSAIDKLIIQATALRG